MSCIKRTSKDLDKNERAGLGGKSRTLYNGVKIKLCKYYMVTRHMAVGGRRSKKSTS